MQRRLTWLTRDEREFESVRDARCEGLELARNWIDADKEEPLQDR
jgi:hypothetical protein